jgi:copper resistance protein D
VAGANFFVAGFAGAGAAMGIVALTMRAGAKPGIGLLALAAVTSGSLVMTSHAAGRLEHRLTLSILTALHQSAAAVWIGGMPYLVLALARCSGILTAQFLCRSFSRMAWIGVIALASSGAAMSLAYIGSAQAIYGTAYGAMVVSKVGMFGILLLLGAFNFFVTRRPMAAESWLLPRLRRFSEAEVGIGFTVILAAASLTSQPPAVDLLAGRVSAAEIAERMRPRWPSLSTPELSALSPATPLGFDAAETQPAGLQSFVLGASYKPNGPGDIAWSEYNHHWAGLIVLGVGLLALLARSGLVGWARHWPLAFLGLAIFLFLRADPENWPLGPRSFWQSFAVAEVLEHRAFVVLIVAFAVFEWRVQTGRVALSRARLVFPLVCASGGALLLTHTHPLGNIKEELLAELSHIPLAIFAVAAGWSRWLELRLAANQQRIPSWLWPVCFVLIGAVLLNYRES